MLQSLRDKAQGWIAWVIVGMIALTFVLYGSEAVFSSGNDKTIAKVNGSKITERQLEMAYRRYLQQPQAASLATPPEEVKKELLQSLVEDRILNNNLNELGMSLSDQKVNGIIAGIPYFQKDGQFSPEMYYQFLNREGYAPQDFQNILKDMVLKQQLQQAILQTAFSVSDEINNLVKFVFQKRDFGIHLIQKDAFKSQVSVSNEEIKQYYEAHLKDYMTDEQIGLEYVVLSGEDLAKQYKFDAKEVENYYQTNKAQFDEPKRVHVAHILINLPKDASAADKKTAEEKLGEIQAQLKQGKSFEALALEYSDDESTKKEGGDLKWLAPGEMVPEFEKAAFALDNKGDVSQSVQTQFGLHLIKLLDKRDAKARSFEEVKDEIAQKIKLQFAEDKLAQMADELSDLVYENADNLQAVQDKLGLKIQTTELFTLKTGPKEALLQNPAVLAQVKSPSVKDDRNNSELIKAGEGQYVVVRVVKHVAPAPRSFDEVKSMIELQLINEKTHELAQAQAQKQFNTLLSLKNNAQAIENAMTWEYQNNVTRSTTGISPEILTGAFAIAWPTSEQAPAVKLVQIDNGDVAILWLKEVENGDIAKLSQEEKDNFRMQMTKHSGELEFAMYATSLFRHAVVKKYDKS